MSGRYKKDRKNRRARGRPKADGPPQGLRADASVLQPRHMLFLHRLHAGKSVEQIAASFRLDTEGLRERLEYTERALDKILHAGNNTHEQEAAGKNTA